tara:strand:- start:987 stop:1256 length:270 start_codon:yes stop_codon:yes gene_type:complete
MIIIQLLNGLPKAITKAFILANYLVTVFMMINLMYLGIELYGLLVTQDYQGNELLPLLGIAISFVLHFFAMCVANVLDRLEWSYDKSMN